MEDGVQCPVLLAVRQIPRAAGFGPASRFLYHYLRLDLEKL